MHDRLSLKYPLRDQIRISEGKAVSVFFQITKVRERHKLRELQEMQKRDATANRARIYHNILQ